MKFSIIMPVYNSCTSLEKSINSILNQNFQNWELIAVDDGSTDNSYDILKKYNAKDSRIKCYTKKNSGPGNTRNYGIDKASGDYIAFLDSDDYYELDFLDKVNELLEKNNCDVIFLNTINEQPSGKVDYCDNLHNFNGMSKDELIGLQMSGKLPWGPCSKVTKAEIVKECTFLDLAVGEESIYSFDLLSKAKSICFLKKPIYHYVHNDSGQHKKGGNDPWKQIVESMNNHLIELNLKSKFNDALASLAINALIISIYRLSLENSIISARLEIRKKIKEYKKDYNLEDYNKNYLNTKSKLIYFLIKHNLILLVIISSKIRKMFYK